MKSKFSNKFSGSRHDEWAGYDYDQLCYRQALTATRLAIEKHHLAMQVQHMKQSSQGTTSIARRMMGALNYFDVALIGFKAFKMMRKFFSRKTK